MNKWRAFVKICVMISLEVFYFFSMHESRSLFNRFAATLAGVALCAAGFLGSAQYAHAAALTSTNVQPASLVAGASSTVTASFTTATNLPNNGKIKVTFPAGFNLSTIGVPVNCTGLNTNAVVSSVVGQVITLTLNAAGATVTAPAAISCTFPTITNPTTAGSTGTYTIITTDSSNVTIDNENAVTADTITSATLTSTNVQPASLRVSVSTSVTVSFTTVNSLETDGKIKVSFPSGFNVSGATNGACSTMDGTVAVSVASQMVTLTRTGITNAAAGAHTCTISGIVNPSTAGSGGVYGIATSNSADGVHDADAAVTADSFSRSSSTSTDPVALTYSIEVSSPAEGDEYAPGDSATITWTSGGTGNMSYANLAYSEDGGTTWTSIATNERNDGSYVWTVPSLSSDEVTVKVEGTDLATVLATGESEAFSVMSSSDTSSDSSDTADTTDEESEDAGSSAGLLPEGTFVRGEASDAVYYVDADGSIRPFLDAQTFFTYADNFDDVVDLSSEEIAEYSMGSPMLPQAGTVLVKVQSVNKVYALVEEDGVSVLRWITSEDLAKELYGNTWADYVIDVPVTAWGRFEIGDEVASADDLSVDVDSMLTRDEINNR